MFKNKLQEARKRKKLSQKELAKLLGVSRTSVAWWEQGRKTPSQENLKKIEKVLNIKFAIVTYQKISTEIEKES